MPTYKFEVSGKDVTDIFPDIGVTSQYAPVSRPTSVATALPPGNGPNLKFNNNTSSMFIPLLAGFA